MVEWVAKRIVDDSGSEVSAMMGYGAVVDVEGAIADEGLEN